MQLTEEDIKNVLYGSIREITKNRNYFYRGYHSHFTEEGYQLLKEMMDLYGEKIQSAIQNDDEARSKELVLKELKKEN